MPSILFVCTANRFRSPLAECAFRFELEKSGIPGTWLVGSAGTWTTSGLPPMHEALFLARELGMDISSHQSRPIDAILLKEFSLTLVMESGQKEALALEFPNSAKKIYLLSEAVGEIAYDIPDPYVAGESPNNIAKELYELIQTGWMQICQLAEKIESEGPSE